MNNFFLKKQWKRSSVNLFTAAINLFIFCTVSKLRRSDQCSFLSTDPIHSTRNTLTSMYPLTTVTCQCTVCLIKVKQARTTHSWPWWGILQRRMDGWISPDHNYTTNPSKFPILMHWSGFKITKIRRPPPALCRVAFHYCEPKAVH